MSTFDETKVKRDGSGQFAPSTSAEADVTLGDQPGQSVPTDAEIEQLRSEVDRLKSEAKQAGLAVEGAVARYASALGLQAGPALKTRSRPSTADRLRARAATEIDHGTKVLAGDLVRHVPEVAAIGADGSLHSRDGSRLSVALPTRQLAQQVADSVPASSPLWHSLAGGRTLQTGELFGRDHEDELGGPNLPLRWPPPPTAHYAGNNSERAEMGRPGHCEKCAQYGHLAAHPEAGCGDVQCSSDH